MNVKVIYDFQEAKTALRKLKTKKAPRLDDVQTEVSPSGECVAGSGNCT